MLSQKLHGGNVDLQVRFNSIIQKTGLKLNICSALSILTPKEIDKYIDSMENESRIMVERLIDVTMNEGSVNPVKYLELCTLNAIFEICFGKQFDSIHDPDFERVAKMIKASVKFAGLENDLANFFPFLSVIDYFIGKQVKMRQFIYNDRNPFLRQAIQDAAALKEGSNLVKLIEEMECDLTEEDIIVLICK